MRKLFFLGYLVLLAGCQPESYDLILRNGTVYAGDAEAGVVMDVAVRDGRIARVGTNLRGEASREIDATGLAVSPGFIDLHTHLGPITLYPSAESHLRMGVTTALGGPDGGSPVPLDDYLDSLQNLGVGLNVAYLVGHNTVRSQVMGLDNRKPTEEELEAMKAGIREGMEDGAFGISTGLKYLPGTYSELPEVIALSKEAGQLGGIYTSHLREEGLGLIEGVAEAITIADRADIPVVLTHHKVVGYPMWGSSKKTLTMVDSAREAGLDVMIDQYPYTASYTSLSILIPAWSMAGGRYEAFAKRCEDPVLRDSIKQAIIFNLKNDRGGNDLRRVQFSVFNWKPEFEGKTLHDWAVAEGLEPTLENGAELIIQAQLHRGASCIFHAMKEEDVERILQHPMTMVASDGRINPIGKGHPHPRVYGTFPRVLGYYVREKGLLSLEEALHKMTTLPAARLGLTDRGAIRKGYMADLTIFDPETIIDRAEFTDPHQYPEGILFVIQGGQVVLENGEFHDLRNGAILRGPAFRGTTSDAGE